MKKLQIIRLDNDLVQKADLQIGNNIISRGAATGRDDSPTVKNAVTINLAPNGEMKITPYQVSPCYIKSKDSPQWRLLKLGISVPIKTGDVCSLLPQKCWFKVISVSNMMEDNDRSLKRKAEEDNSDSVISEKKKCLDSTTNISTDQNSEESVVTVGTTQEESAVQDKEQVPQDVNLLNNTEAVVKVESPVEDICRASNSVQNNDKLHGDDSKSTVWSEDTILHSKHKQAEKEHKEVNINIAYGQAGTSVSPTGNTKQNHSQHNTSSESHKKTAGSPLGGKARASVSNNNNNNPRRNKCAYGNKCYRKNRHHKTEFSHPGDSDFELSDDREECPYGIKCYRKNPQHKTQFKHTALRKGRKRTLVQVQPLDNSSPMEDSSYEESVDESDYEPSLYTDTSDGNRSDWEDYPTESGENGSEWEDGTTG